MTHGFLLIARSECGQMTQVFAPSAIVTPHAQPRNLSALRANVTEPSGGRRRLFILLRIIRRGFARFRVTSACLLPGTAPKSGPNRRGNRGRGACLPFGKDRTQARKTATRRVWPCPAVHIFCRFSNVPAQVPPLGMDRYRLVAKRYPISGKRAAKGTQPAPLCTYPCHVSSMKAKVSSEMRPSGSSSGTFVGTAAGCSAATG